MKSLYEDLGVEKTATAQEIKSAYRKRVQQTHPDKGGKTEDFRKVQAAYDVLGDPERRRRYDATGDTGSGADGIPPASAILARTFTEIVDSMLTRDDRDYLDPVQAMHRAVADMMRNASRDLKSAEARATALRKIQKRLRRRHGAEPLFESVIDAQLAPQEATIADCKAWLERLGESKRMLGDYSYEEFFETFVLTGAASPKPKARRATA